MTDATRTPEKIVIGLTGNIGVGKSTVMALLAGLGAVGIDADKVAHQVMEPGQPAYQQIMARFGRQIAPDGGPIDRLRLGQIVFSDPAALADLEAIVHPAVFQVIQRGVAAADAPVVMIEAIKLLEGPLAGICDQVWVTTCARTTQLERLRVCRGLDEAAAVARVDAQSSQKEKIARADVVIYTDGPLSATEEQFAAAWGSIGTSD